MINISIDDVSPHPWSSVKVLEQCETLIKKYDDIKFTLFIPIAYWRTLGKEATQKPLSIDEYPEFCNILRNLPKKNYEIGYHGYLHGIPFKSNNDEFKSLDYDQACKLFNMMFATVQNANLLGVFKPIFRPPAWRMSPGAIKAARDKGIKVLALSSDGYAKETYEGLDETNNDVVYLSSSPPIYPLKQTDKNEIVYHACEWDKNYLSNDKVQELIDFLDTFEEKKFCFIKDMLDG